MSITDPFATGPALAAEQNELTGQDPKRLTLFRRHGIAFVHIPKTGGRSFAQMLYGDVPIDHRPARALRDIDPEGFDGMLRLAFVRNPYDRIASAYADLTTGGDRDGQALLRRAKNFRKFALKALSERMFGSEAELAFRPQTWFLQSPEVEGLLVDIVLKLEAADPALAALAQIDTRFAGLRLPWVDRRTPHLSCNHVHTYDATTADIIYDLYRSDFETFGYDRDSWMRADEARKIAPLFAVEMAEVCRFGSCGQTTPPKVIRYFDCTASTLPSRGELIRYLVDAQKLCHRSAFSLLGQKILRPGASHAVARNPAHPAVRAEAQVTVTPEEDLQCAIDRIADAGGGTVFLSEGVFEIRRPIALRDRVRIIGAGMGDHFADLPSAAGRAWRGFNAPGRTAGPGETVCVYPDDARWPMFCNLTKEEIDQMVAGKLRHGATIGRALEDVVLADFRIWGGLRDDELCYPQYYHEDDHPGHVAAELLRYHAVRSWDRLAIFITADSKTICRGVHMARLTVTQAGMGIQIRNGHDISLIDSVLFRNGGIGEHWHNLYFRRCTNVVVSRNILADCRSGNGMNMTEVGDIDVTANLIADNYFRGVRIQIQRGQSRFAKNLIIGNGETGLRMVKCMETDLTTNFIRDNGRNFSPDDYIIGRNATMQYIDSNAYIKRSLPPTLRPDAVED